MAERVRVREITNDEGNRLLRMVRRSSGSVVTWRRAQMVLLSAQGMDTAMIAQVTFTSPDRVRDVLHNFNADGFDSLQPKYLRHQVVGQLRRRWAANEVRQGVVEDISHEGLRMLLREEGVSFPGRQDLEDQHGPESRGQEDPRLGALCDCRRQTRPRQG